MIYLSQQKKGNKLNFKTELHCHSTTVSKCASATPETIVETYLAHGYTTVVLTDHFSRFTFNNKKHGDRRGHTHAQRVDFFLDGTEALREAAGDRLFVIQGCELRLNTDDNDYQIYGDSGDFLYANPDIMDIDIAELSRRTHEAGLLLIQAHPFRNEMRISDPRLLDGIEVYNGAVGHDSRNDIALRWAERCPHLIRTSGSDYHRTSNGLVSGGIVTDAPITSNTQLISVLRSGGYTILGDPYLLPAKRFIAEGGTVKEEEMRRVGLID